MVATVEQSAISVNDLTVGFGKKIVLDHLSLEVRRGESSAWSARRAEENRLCCERSSVSFRNARATSRSWAWNSTRPTPGKSGRSGGGGVFCFSALFSSLTVRQNIQFPMRENLEISSSLLDEMATAKLEMVGLSQDDGDKFPSELSGGMTKRAALARALALDPEIVFLDEPTSGLDPISAGEFDVLISTLQRTFGLTVFMVTHDLDSLHTVCDRVAALADGKMAAIGPIQELLASEHPWVKSYFHGDRARVRAGVTH